MLKLFSDELVQKGFILVLDRRKDKWGAVKSCLQKLQVSNENVSFHNCLQKIGNC